MRREDIERLIRQYLSGGSLDDFRQFFASAYVAVRQDVKSGRDVSELCNRLIGPLAEFSRGHRSLESLRCALADAMEVSRNEVFVKWTEHDDAERFGIVRMDMVGSSFENLSVSEWVPVEVPM